MGLPARFRTHTITVEPYEGSGAYGPVFGAAVQVSCRVEDKVQLVRSNIGEEVVSSTTVYCDVGVTIPAGSRVTVKGRVTSVISVGDPSTGGRSPLDHMEVYVK
jgi:hypothetical protein